MKLTFFITSYLCFFLSGAVAIVGLVTFLAESNRGHVWELVATALFLVAIGAVAYLLSR